MRPAQRRDIGLTFVPEERLGRGAVPALSLTDNALLTGARAGMVSNGLINKRMAREFARDTIDKFQVKCGGEQAAASSLSGGNLQKFIVGRETKLAPKMMVVAQPTWGVDIGAAQMIRQALIDLRDGDVALLVISEELDELFMICDRIAVLAQGRLSPTFATSELTREQVGVLMTGVTVPGANEPRGMEQAVHV
jgi:simple sugar transport system ATP-binding protein